MEIPYVEPQYLGNLMGGEGTILIPKDQYNYYETSDKQFTDGTRKNVWEDYSDLLINKNQAIEQDVEGVEFNNDVVRVKGHNQFWGSGMITIISDKPIDQNIKNNYTLWGEK